MIQLTDAIVSLYSNAQFILTNEDYSTLIWPEGSSKPSKETLEAEVSRLQAIEDSLEYQRDREPEYPSIKEFADAYYWAQKGDNTLMDAYVTKCDAVKAKYPKPE